MLASDEHARFMWVHIHQHSPLHQDIYIAVCYFPPASSHFAFRESKGDLFLDLYVDISHYSTLREVILLRDFNARTKDLWVPYHDRIEAVLCLQEIMLEFMDLSMHLWAEATRTAVYVQNKSPHRVLGNKTPEEMFSREKP